MSNCPHLDDYAAPTSTYHCDDHLQVCGTCRTAVSELAALRALSTQLDDGLPSEDRVADVRKRLLQRATSQHRFAYAPWLAIAALLSVAVLSASLWLPQTPTPSGRIIDEKNARYAIAHEGEDEQIHLRDGTITIEVNHLKPGQRFRVITEDAEVEVRGTAFRVRARNGRLQDVTVLEGRVEVRPTGQPAQLLKRRQRWTASAPHALTEKGRQGLELTREVLNQKPKTEQLMTSKEQPSGPPKTPDHGPIRKPKLSVPIKHNHSSPNLKIDPRARQPDHAKNQQTAVKMDHVSVAMPRKALTRTMKSLGVSNTRQTPVIPSKIKPEKQQAKSQQLIDFDAGWTHLRQGNPKAAIPYFTSASRTDGALTEDATWWRAIALGRAEHDRAAYEALQTYQAKYADGPRRFKAWLMMAWYDFAEGRIEQAEALFRKAVASSEQPVEQRAQEGLNAVKKARMMQKRGLESP